MSNVKRYKTTWDRLGIASSDDAVFVLASDYDALAAELAEATQERNAYREGQDRACEERDRLRAALERIANGERTGAREREIADIAREALRGADK